MPYKAWVQKNIRHRNMASLDDFDDDNEQVTAEFGDLGLTAAGFDYFNFDEPIELCIGKIGSLC